MADLHEDFTHMLKHSRRDHQLSVEHGNANRVNQQGHGIVAVCKLVGWLPDCQGQQAEVNEEELTRDTFRFALGGRTMI